MAWAVGALVVWFIVCVVWHWREGQRREAERAESDREWGMRL